MIDRYTASLHNGNLDLICELDAKVLTEEQINSMRIVSNIDYKEVHNGFLRIALKKLDQAVESVEKEFEKVKLKYGDEISEIMWANIIDSDTQDQLAQEYGMSVRTLKLKLAEVRNDSV